MSLLLTSWQKILVPILSDITQNEFTVQDSFTFVAEIVTQDSDVDMASLGVDSFIYQHPLHQTVDICVNKLSQNPVTLVNGISKNDFRDLLKLATTEPFFRHYNKFYIQADGVTTASPLGSILANIFLPHHDVL